jgi:hypothetical protein
MYLRLETPSSRNITDNLLFWIVIFANIKGFIVMIKYIFFLPVAIYVIGLLTSILKAILKITLGNILLAIALLLGLGFYIIDNDIDISNYFNKVSIVNEEEVQETIKGFIDKI